MKRDDLKKIVDEAINTSSVIDATTEPQEYNVYTNVWHITTAQLDKIRSKVNVTNIISEGGKITLTIKL